jgi:hypothetical protein
MHFSRDRKWVEPLLTSMMASTAGKPWSQCPGDYTKNENIHSLLASPAWLLTMQVCQLTLPELASSACLILSFHPEHGVHLFLKPEFWTLGPSS